MKNVTLGVIGIPAVFGVLISILLFGQFSPTQKLSCQEGQKLCTANCEAARERAFMDIADEIIVINTRRRQALLDCGIETTQAQNCRRDVNRAADAEIAALKGPANAAYNECALQCMKGFSQCKKFPPPPKVLITGDINIGCLGESVCPVPVSQLCEKVSGVCGDCATSLCGGGEWMIDSGSLPLEVNILAGTDDLTSPRVLARSVLKGKKNFLNVPSNIKLKDGERLYFTFSSTEKVGHSVKAVFTEIK